MKLRMPRPFWIFLTTVGLVVAGIGLRFGIPAYQQRCALREIRPYGSVEVRHVGPDWLRRLVGDRMDAFDEIEAVDFRSSIAKYYRFHRVPRDDGKRWPPPVADSEPVVDDSALACIRKLPTLKHVYLHCTNVGDAGMEHVCALQKLEILDLGGTHVSDASIPLLKRLNNLRSLDLRWTRVTDEGLKQLHLHKKKSLKMLQVDTTQVTDAGVAELQKALPELELHVDRATFEMEPIDGVEPEE